MKRTFACIDCKIKVKKSLILNYCKIKMNSQKSDVMAEHLTIIEAV